MSALPESLARFRGELEAAIRREQESHAYHRDTGLPRGLVGRRGRTVLALAVVAAAAVAALFVSTPWQDPPGFSLERAQAALTPPAGTILHMKWEETWISTDLACTVTRPVEIWIDQESLRYRVFRNVQPAAPVRAFVCEEGTPAEFGNVATGEEYEFVPPNSFRASDPFPFVDDPVAGLREALETGRAHDEGTTQLDGRTVQRIRFGSVPTCPTPDCPQEPWYGFVDPETFEPVAFRGPGFFGRGVPPDVTVVRLHMSERFLTYEYLPRSEANVALTDIRVQHPDATGP
jgi:hypothetical protein